MSGKQFQASIFIKMLKSCSYSIYFQTKMLYDAFKHIKIYLKAISAKNKSKIMFFFFSTEQLQLKANIIQ